MEDSSDEERATFEKWKKDDIVVKCYMMASMVPELARKYESYVYAADIKAHLEAMYVEKIRAVRFAATKELMTLMLQEEALVHEHCLKMMTLLEKLTDLDVVLPRELALDIILLSLPKSYENFIVSLNINKLDPPLKDLANMLKTYESTIKKDKLVLLLDTPSTSSVKNGSNLRKSGQSPQASKKKEKGEPSTPKEKTNK